MHIKHIHETIECLAEYGKELVKAGTGSEEVNLEATSKIIDMIKDLSEAEYYARISKAMEESEKEDEEEAKRIMREMKEEYGDEEGERRFYDNYRYKRTGRFAPRGRGSYVGRRGYEEPPYYRMSPEMYKEHDPEWYRDMDRDDGRMYYSGGGSNSNGSSSNMGGSRSGGSMGGNSGNMGGGSSSRGYSDGYSDGMSEGTKRGYEDGMRDGERRGRNSQTSRYDRAKRGYEEHKMNKDDSPEGKKKSMENLEEYMRELGTDMSEMIGKMDSSEKAMVRTKLQTLMQKIQ